MIVVARVDRTADTAAVALAVFFGRHLAQLAQDLLAGHAGLGNHRVHLVPIGIGMHG